ncbi:hypothetical protein ECG_08401 [Echinococcus granulosus]|nr:hypothetical protein ECG_08401 [Echinococcus granulosus]
MFSPQLHLCDYLSPFLPLPLCVSDAYSMKKIRGGYHAISILLSRVFVCCLDLPVMFSLSQVHLHDYLSPFLNLDIMLDEFTVVCSLPVCRFICLPSSGKCKTSALSLCCCSRDTR